LTQSGHDELEAVGLQCDQMSTARNKMDILIGGCEPCTVIAADAVSVQRAD
jgi:hypothetical protein